MSLVQIANICSHIQNASRVRLGLTSIPATKAHVSLMLALQKQGFLSSVTLGSKNPPLSFGLSQPPEYSIEEQEATSIQEEPWRAFPDADTKTKSLKQQSPGVQSQAHAEGRNLNGLNGIQEEIWRSRDRVSELGGTFRGLITEEALAQNPEGAITKAIERYTQWSSANAVESMTQDERWRAYEDSIAKSEAQSSRRKHLTTDASIKADPNHAAQPSLPLMIRAEKIPDNPAQRRLWLGLKYWNSEPVLRSMKMISKPTKRITAKWTDLKAILNGRTRNEIRGIVNPGECIFIFTDQGVLEIREAVERRMGGLVACRVE